VVMVMGDDNDSLCDGSDGMDDEGDVSRDDGGGLCDDDNNSLCNDEVMVWINMVIVCVTTVTDCHSLHDHHSKLADL